MILAWVLSLLLLLSALMNSLERMTALNIIGLQTFQTAQENFRAAELAVLECEKNLAQIGTLPSHGCHIQSMGGNRWLITSQRKPVIEVLVSLDKKTGVVTRLHWRQQIE